MYFYFPDTPRVFAFQHLHMISSNRWLLTYEINLGMAVCRRVIS